MNATGATIHFLVKIWMERIIVNYISKVGNMMALNCKCIVDNVISNLFLYEFYKN
jgi:hypothetical protein